MISWFSIVSKICDPSSAKSTCPIKPSKAQIGAQEIDVCSATVMARKSLEGMRTSADPAPRLFCLAELNKYYRQSGNIMIVAEEAAAAAVVVVFMYGDL